MWKRIAMGAVAGAAGTTALNMTTYLDMAVRGRPSSGVPSQVVGTLAENTGISLGDEETAENRKSGLGALLGYFTGLGWGIVYGLAYPAVSGMREPVAGVVLGLGVMAGSDVPAVATGITDPRTWGVQGWASDIVPHLAYGLVTAAVYETLRDA